jgi:hypothetical protein
MSANAKVRNARSSVIKGNAGGNKKIHEKQDKKYDRKKLFNEIFLSQTEAMADITGATSYNCQNDLLSSSKRKEKSAVTNSSNNRGEKTISTEGVLDQGSLANFFEQHEIQQTERSPHAAHIAQNAYLYSNRFAVTLGVAGGIVAGPMGMTIGSTVGTHAGALVGASLEYFNPTSENQTKTSSSDVPNANNPATHEVIFNHVVEAVDHAGHHAAIGSIGVGITALLTSLATGNPMPTVLHVAGVYSGAAWGLGLTTGTASWLCGVLQRSSDEVASEKKSH